MEFYDNPLVLIKLQDSDEWWNYMDELNQVENLW